MAPATPADLFLHVRGDRFDLCFELARRVRAQLGEAVRVVEDIHGFRYLDSRDLTGFVDGTENPQGEDDRARVALLSEGPFAGGSYLNIQRYVHDLAKWARVDTAAQEDVIGRTKADDVEFDRDRLPATAHIARVSIKQDGKSLAILRHSMPYGTADEHGLYFVAYAARPDTVRPHAPAHAGGRGRRPLRPPHGLHPRRHRGELLRPVARLARGARRLTCGGNGSCQLNSSSSASASFKSAVSKPSVNQP